MKEIICSGALFCSLNTKRFLFLHRAKSKRKNVWGIVGGTNEDLETPWIGLQREILEEVGPSVPKIIKTLPLETFVSKDSHFSFHTYVCLVKEEFIPMLNNEHNGYCWTSINNWPKPLHQGLYNTLNAKTNQKKLSTILNSVQHKLFSYTLSNDVKDIH